MNVVEEYGLDRTNFIWQKLALCAGLATNLFYDWSESDKILEQQAKEICSLCPVKDICKPEAISNKESGIWGEETLKDGRIIN